MSFDKRSQKGARSYFESDRALALLPRSGFVQPSAQPDALRVPVSTTLSAPPQMDRKLFSSLLAKRLYPYLRAQGFQGSGATLRRIAEPVVEVFNVQASSGGTRCYFNLGLHLTFLPAEGGRAVEASELTESQCAFRSRIEPPPGQQFGWAYGSSVQEAESNVERAVLEWERQAPFWRWRMDNDRYLTRDEVLAQDGGKQWAIDRRLDFEAHHRATDDFLRRRI